MSKFARCLLMCLIGCSNVQNLPDSTKNSQSQPIAKPTLGAQQAVQAYLRVGSQIEPIAERLCREKNPSAPSTYCDFQIKIDTSNTNTPNAYQTIGEDGRPIIAFNIPMLATIKNDHEIAFILGHEAGHQIRNHILKSSANANLGALVLGSIFSASGASQTTVGQAANLGGKLGARAYSQSHELQADVVGTYISEIAGYNSLIGAQSFSRFSGGGGFSTHPPSNQRITTVQRTAAEIATKRAAGQPLLLP